MPTLYTQLRRIEKRLKNPPGETLDKILHNAFRAAGLPGRLYEDARQDVHEALLSIKIKPKAYDDKQALRYIATVALNCARRTFRENNSIMVLRSHTLRKSKRSQKKKGNEEKSPYLCILLSGETVDWNDVDEYIENPENEIQDDIDLGEYNEAVVGLLRDYKRRHPEAKAHGHKAMLLHWLLCGFAMISADEYAADPYNIFTQNLRKLRRAAESNTQKQLLTSK